jgi:hypothetical protein
MANSHFQLEIYRGSSLQSTQNARKANGASKLSQRNVVGESLPKEV